MLYMIDAKEHYQCRNIPISNTTVVILGTAISITQATLCMLVSAVVLLGFCRIERTLLSVTSKIGWLSPQGECRQAEHTQGWPA